LEKPHDACIVFKRRAYRRVGASKCAPQTHTRGLKYTDYIKSIYSDKPIGL